MISGTAAQLQGGNKSRGSAIVNKLGYSLLYIVLIGVAILQLFPLVWLLFFLLKNNQEVFNLPPLSLPMNPRWENYGKVWSAGNIDVYFLNSVWITVTATLATVVIASLVTFAITRMKWRGSSLVLGLFMVAMMIPVHSTLIPLFSMFNKVSLIDHPLSLLLTYVAFNMPITIMILLGFYYALPKEVEEAAVIDGCSVNRMFFSIVFPMTSSVLATTAIINIIYNWNC